MWGDVGTLAPKRLFRRPSILWHWARGDLATMMLPTNI
jgi:hypothetical protein